MNDTLVLVADGRILGEIRRDRRGRLTLVYDAAWRALHGAWPLSLSMPLIVAQHEHGRIAPWLRRLLPDDDIVLDRWAQRFHVSPRDVFALIAAVGEDCAGAIQLVRPERVASILDARAMSVEWLTRADMAERLRGLRKDHASARKARDPGQFTLAGAAPKIALFFNGQHWGVPSGRTPTTHIVKPSVDGADGHVQNAHLCLALARALGLPAARTTVLRLEDQVALAVERFDRVRDNGAIRRLHQESLAQSLGLRPTRKERRPDDAPESATMIELIRAHSGQPQEDAWTLARAVMLNWLIAGSDGHATDFSILIGAGGRARLAPLHGLSSTLLRPGADAKQRAIASVRDVEHGFDEIGQRRWVKFAAAARLPAAEIVEACRDMARALPDALHAVTAQARREGGDHPLVPRLVELLTARAERCGRTLAG